MPVTIPVDSSRSGPDRPDQTGGDRRRRDDGRRGGKTGDTTIALTPERSGLTTC